MNTIEATRAMVAGMVADARTQEIVEEQLLTFEAQKKMLNAARGASMDAYHNAVNTTNLFGVNSALALAAQLRYVRARSHMVEVSCEYERLVNAYMGQYFPVGIKL